MIKLSDLEREVLAAIAVQVPLYARELHEQLASATVVSRENTGAGFYTRLAVATTGPKMEGAPSPLGDVQADVQGLEHGMGFLLWVRDGLAYELEAYTYDASTAGLDLAALSGSNVGPRMPSVG